MVKLWGKKKPAPTPREHPLYLAFVLLREPTLPSVFSVIEHYAEFAGPDNDLDVDATLAAQSPPDKALDFVFGEDEHALVALMPVPVPNREAEAHVPSSIATLGEPAKLAPHAAHLTVIMQGIEGLKPMSMMMRLTSLLAAIARASDAVGIYWGNAGATHGADFFCSVAEEASVFPRIMLWSGVSIAQEKRGRASILSLGMEQLRLPNLLLEVPGEHVGDAIQRHYEIIAYIAERGTPLPEGDTIGESMHDRSVVRYVKSPIDSSKQVCKISM